MESPDQVPQTSVQTNMTIADNKMCDAAVINKSQSDKSSLLMDVTFSSGSTGRGKFDLVFQKESNVEIAQRRELARKPYKSVDEKELEKDVNDFFPVSCDYPKRPKWNKSMSKVQVEANEAKYFRQYVSDIMEKHEQKLSFFELNLEVWSLVHIYFLSNRLFFHFINKFVFC